MTIWVDFTNPPHVNFFNPLIMKFQDSGHQVNCTARDFVETIDLLKLYDISFRVFGKHGGKKKSKKIISLLSRELKLYFNIDEFDFNFCSNYEAPFISWLKRKPSFVFDDNDISPNWLYSRFARFVVSPKYIDKDAMYKMGIKKDQLLFYDGFKENIYIADYQPDHQFLDKIPFKEFVTVRPENLQATYVGEGGKSIVPELVDGLLKKELNILFLPRYKSDRDLIKMSDKVFIPDKPLNGLDVSYHSSAVLTGAGSFSREAAVFGTPAVSFFAGKTFLGVDKEMFKRGDVFFSRQPSEIIDFVLKSSKKPFDAQKSKTVQDNLFKILEKIMTHES
jgi:predicted glycosyltransferase